MMTALTEDIKYDCRQAEISDAEEIHSLMKQAFADYAVKKTNKDNKKEVINSALRESLEDIMIDLENNIVMVVIENKKVIASLRLEEISNNRYLLKRFAVAPSHQNQGIGTMIFKNAVIELKKLNASYIQLYSSLENNKLICFYQDLGFNCLEKDSKKGYLRGLWVKTVK